VIGRCGADNKVQRLSRALDSRKTTVERFHLDRLFRAILIEGELGYGKPEPKVHAEALRQLGIEATEAWSIGDHLEWDVAAPQRLGLYAVWSDFRRAGLPDGTTVVPDRIIHSISELAPGSEIEQ
jgi:putative hydrolase of the HAD superfamily